MQTGHQTSEIVAAGGPEPSSRQSRLAARAALQPSIAVGLLTGGQDRHYAVGLGTALLENDVTLDVIGSDEVDGPEFQSDPRVRFHNLHGAQQSAGLSRKIARILAFYARLIKYSVTARPRIFHILWNNKLPLFDRTLLMVFYKLMGKKIVITAHNVNAGKRDGTDSWLNRSTLKGQYALSDHIFVHTKKMKDELIEDFGVAPGKITIIPYGINNAVPSSDLTRHQARERLGFPDADRVLLYFGAIKQYKGLEDLVAAFAQIAPQGDYRLIIAGERKKGHESYWQSIRQTIERHPARDKILQKIEFIPDHEIEIYFKAADVAVLPYTDIFQSGILFLAYAYGLPVIATDVGSFAEDILEGRSGFICRPRDPEGLARTIQHYFATDLYADLERRREEIKTFAFSRHSWEIVAQMTRDVYSHLLESRSRA